MDPHLEAKIHLAVRQAIAAMGVPTLPIPGLQAQPPPSLGPAEGNAMTLDEMEAAHKAGGLKIVQVMQEQEALRAEEARLAEKQTRALQAEQHVRLRELAAEDFSATLAFVEKREKMARESQATCSDYGMNNSLGS